MLSVKYVTCHCCKPARLDLQWGGCSVVAIILGQYYEATCPKVSRQGPKLGESRPASCLNLDSLRCNGPLLRRGSGGGIELTISLCFSSTSLIGASLCAGQEGTCHCLGNYKRNKCRCNLRRYSLKAGVSGIYTCSHIYVQLCIHLHAPTKFLTSFKIYIAAAALQKHDLLCMHAMLMAGLVSWSVTSPARVPGALKQVIYSRCSRMSH